MNLRVKRLALFISFSAACLGNPYSAIAADPAAINSSQAQSEKARPPRDLTPPVITLNGDSEMSIYQGTTFIDPKATAVDAVDGAINVTVRGWVNTYRPGTYTITYSAVDSKGNKATAKRKVTVIADTIAPVITLNGESAMSIIQNGIFDDQGATATDNLDGEVNVKVVGRVRRSIPGIYTLAYVAQDSAGNEARVNRTVTVIADTTPPIIILRGDSTLTIAQGSNFSDPGAEATDNSGVLIQISTSGTVNTGTVGEYKITYRARDRSGNISTVTRTVKVVAPTPTDTIAPVITLNGAASIELTVGDTYTDAGATATDDVDGKITVTTTGSVDTTTAGTYTLTYTAKDAAGNQADPVTRTVVIKPKANVAPTANAGSDQIANEQTAVTLTGSGTDTDGNIASYAWTQTAGATVTLTSADQAQASFTAPDVTADTELTFKLTVTDDKGATAEDTVTITVKAVDSTKPVITLNGAASVELTVGDTYTDAGATATDDVDGTVNVTTTGSVDTTTAGTYTLTYTAQDAAGNQADPVTRTVVIKPKANVAPTANAGSDQIANEQTAVTLTGSGTDTDGNIASYAWTQTAGATVTLTSADQAQASFTAPDVTADTELTFKLTVTDDKGATAEDTVSIMVQALTGNIAPTANAGNPTIAEGNQEVSLSGDDSHDADGSIVSYLWTQTGGNTVTLIDANTSNPKFTTPAISAGDPNQVLTFKLQVTDNEGASAESTTTVTVKYDVTPPNLLVYASNPTQIIIGNEYSPADASAVDDIDGQVSVTYTGDVNPNTLGEYLTTYSATDSSGNTVSQTITVEVIPVPNVKPTAVIGAPQTVTGNTVVLLDGSNSTDSDGTIANYAWTQLSGSPVTLNDSGTSQTSFIAPSSAEDQTLVFKLVITDNQGEDDFKTTFVQIKGSSTTITPITLNDTGITLCASATSSTQICSTNHINQDAQVGRDFTHNDNSDGYAGFSFTKIDANGQALSDQTANYATTPWACIKDNVTGLTWEVKTDDGGLHDLDWTYSWYNPDFTKNGRNAGIAANGQCNAAGNSIGCDTLAYVQSVNAENFCGENDWRLPSVNEMISLFHYNYNQYTTNPTDLDPNYFPYRLQDTYWTNTSTPELFGEVSNYAWTINLRSRTPYPYGDKSDNNRAILVRGAKY